MAMYLEPLNRHLTAVGHIVVSIAVACDMAPCMQAQEQLLLELELSVVATKWRHRRTQQHVLAGWSRAAAAAAQEREQQARLQETFSKVQGWLSEMKGEPQSGNSSNISGAAAHGAAAASAGLPALKQLPSWKDWDPESESDEGSADGMVF